MQFKNALYTEELCKNGDRENKKFSDISLYPVHDVRSGISYLNMFCYLNATNHRINQTLILANHAWDIESYCEKIIEPKNLRRPWKL